MAGRSVPEADLLQALLTLRRSRILMLIKVFTSSVDGFDSLNPPLDETDFTVNLYRLPHGYIAQTDSRGYRYIRCPNGAAVYDLDQSVRRDAVCVKFSYWITPERKRTVRLELDRQATHDMIFSGENYRCLP